MDSSPPRTPALLPSVVLGALALAGLYLVPAPASAVGVPPGFVVENAFPGATFDRPTQIVFMADGRKLVVEQGGAVWMMDADGTQRPTPFIDLSDRVLSNGGRGLLGVALDPDFDVNRWVYFAYTVDPDSNGLDYNQEAYSRLERYQVSAVDSNVIDLTTRQILIGVDWPHGIPMPDYYHTIGAIRFGADKTLLLASGEGAHFDAADAGGLDSAQFLPGRADPSEDIGSFRSQSLNSLGGKILRLDKDTGHGLPSNPYWDGDSTSARSRVWIYGVRNPYRFIVKPGTGSTDPSLGDPGTLYIGDTGWNVYEQVRLAREGGLNMGWPCEEGPGPQPLYQAITATAAGDTNVLCGAPPSDENPVGPTFPLIWYHHSDGSLSDPVGWTGHATVGGTFSGQDAYPPPYGGSFFVADFSDSWIHWFAVNDSDQVTGSGDFLTGGDSPVDVERDPSTGELYYVAQLTNEVRRIRYMLGSEPQALCARADSATGTGAYPIPGAGSPWTDLAGGHSLTLTNFAGDASSGWQGDGTVSSPYRLRFDGVDDRVTAPPGSVPELQSPSTATASLWFKTGSDVDTYQYLIEWLSEYDVPFRGMTVAVAGGQLRVFLNPWQDAFPVAPNTWYHVTVAKDSSETRVYEDGVQKAVFPASNLGGQTSEIVLGASTYRGPGVYGDFFSGALAQVCLWPVALTAGEVLATFQADQNLFLPVGPKIACVRADSASGTGPPAVPGAASPWKDLIDSHDASLVGFAGDATSGWQGDGTVLSPYRLKFDGVDDHVTLPAASITELQGTSGASVALWFKTGPDVTSTQYLLEWVSQYASPYPGMTLAIANGHVRVRLDTWVDIQAVAPNSWYYVTVAKDAGEVRAYVNEFKRFTGSSPNLGAQASELVLGASTYRGPGDYGEFFTGSIAQMCIWKRALVDPEVQEAFHESQDLYLGPPPVWAKVVCMRADSANGTSHYPIPGKGSPWRDLIGGHDGTLKSFNGNAGSGWQGSGTPSDPYALQFDGSNDRVVIPKASVPELISPTAVTAALWFRTGPDITSTQYLLEWVDQYALPYPGMSIAIENAHLRVFLNPWVDILRVDPDTWYHVAVSKEPGSVLVYVNGAFGYSGSEANLGGQTSEIVLGASTYRGAGHYGEYFTGRIGELCLWPVALNADGIRAAFLADSADYQVASLADAPSVGRAVEFTAQPNPFQGSLTLAFSLARPGDVSLEIYDVDGRRVRTILRGSLPEGLHRLRWDGRDDAGRRVRAGIYFAELGTPEIHVVRRLALLR